MSHLTCEQFVELVTDFLDGALDAEQERRFTEHLGYCDGCDSYLEQFRTTIAGLRGLPTEQLPDDTRSALLAAFRERSDNP